MVLAKGLRSRSRYCWAGTDNVASRAVSTLEVRVLAAFVVSFASAMRQQVVELPIPKPIVTEHKDCCRTSEVWPTRFHGVRR
jgi:hypothetical protein